MCNARRWIAWPFLLAVAFCPTTAKAADEPFQQQDLFVSGQGGYHTYRIPAIAVTRKGTALAFCEGRKTSAADDGDIDLLLRRSLDGGKTWLPVQRVHEEEGGAPITIGNPCPIAAADGTIHLLFTRNNQRAFSMRSSDEGATFSSPVEITAALHTFDFAWRRLGTGPVHGIQTRQGRLVAPIWLNVKIGSTYRTAVAVSDDNGRSWKAGGLVPPSVKDCNEAAVVEADDGSLWLNMRNRQTQCRAVAVSRDQGQTWSEPKLVEELVDPQCQASLLNISSATSSRYWLLSNAADTKRRRMTLTLSTDNGVHWSAARVLATGPAAYSDLALCNDGSILCLFECGEKGPYEKIRLARIAWKWLVGGAK